MNGRTDTPLVSVIVPCYNAERWVRETIDSVLNQTYSPIELIVIDDGSTDRSLEIIRAYEGRLRWETGPNRGGCAARNRGFGLAKGEYIQFLDADDYLLPEKIERQADFLQATGADVVYGDWRYQYHSQNGQVEMGPIIVSGEQNDVMRALLAGWWVAPGALLYRYQTVQDAGGWDESVQAAQDRDFLYSVALTGADIRYQPGCHTIYRSYGNATVSTSNRPRLLSNQTRVVEKIERRLIERNRLSEDYAHALAYSYFELARGYYELDRAQYQRLMEKVLSLNPRFVPRESSLYTALWSVLGYRRTEWVALTTRTWRHKLVDLKRALTRKR